MSSRHLKTSDPKPAFDPKTKFRLYSMLYCPYAQRVRLIIAAKKIADYDIINIQLRENVPDWYSSVNPLKKVPAIEFSNSEVLYESLILADYFDELYPKNPLHPSDPLEKAEQRLFVENYGNSFIPIYYKSVRERTDENKQALVAKLSDYENHLMKKKCEFFGGSKPAMVDYMIWPWFERLPLVYDLSAELFPNLSAWFKKMHDIPAVKEVALPVDIYKKFYAGYMSGNVDYDLVK